MTPVSVFSCISMSPQRSKRRIKCRVEEIVSGKRTRISTAAEDTHEIMERARTSLQTIVKAIEEHPGTGQTRRLVRFLAGRLQRPRISL